MALPYHSCQIIVYQPWGTPITPPLSKNLTSDAAWEAAQKRPGAILNLHRQFAKNLDKDATRDYQVTSAICLSYELTFPDGANFSGQGNAVSDWNNIFPNSLNYLDIAPDWSGYGQALVNSYAGTNQEIGFAAATPFIKKNTPFSVLLELFEPPKYPSPTGKKVIQVFLLEWSDYTFMLYNGEPRMAKKASTFNVADFRTWQTLQFQITRSDADQAQLDTLQKSLFDDYKVLDLHHGKDEWWKTPVVLTFMPEPRGVINVIREGGGADQFKVSSIAGNPHRAPGILWPDCAPGISTNFGAFIWQFGYPVFATNGTFTGEAYDYATWALTSGITWNGLWDSETVTPGVGSIGPGFTPNTNLPGTSITFDNPPVVPVPAMGNPHQIRFRLEASTDRRLTPFLYTLQAFIPAGTRDGYPESIIYDSSAHTDAGGNPILDVSPVYEDDQKTLCRRRGCDVTLRDIYGALALTSTGYATLENCMVDVYVDKHIVLGNGIIKEVQVNNVNSADAGCKADTQVKMTISDMWSILEDDAMFDQPIGDGVRLNDYIVTILQGAGVAASEYSGITYNTGGPSSGHKLPQAALGEKPCIRPEFRHKRSDFLRTLIEKYGDGQTLRCWSGIWTLGPKPTVVGTDAIGTALRGTTQTWNFSSSGSRNSAVSFPGRYVILEKSDVIKDASDFYNYFRVQGANDHNGNPIVQFWPERRSINSNYKGTSIYLGHWKDYPDVHDTSLRTLNDVLTVLNTLIKNHCVSFWFQTFETYFHPLLNVGTMIQADNVIGIVTRISGASARDDRMTVTYMQLYTV
jgi:hypothetical protein